MLGEVVDQEGGRPACTIAASWPSFGGDMLIPKSG